MRVAKINANILGDIEVPKEYLQWLREKIVREHKIEQGQEITLEQVKKWHQVYGSVLSERMFAVQVLDMRNYNHLAIGDIQKSAIIPDEVTTDWENLRYTVMRKKHLHREDRINYIEFQRLHRKYAPNTPEYVFADRVLDIELQRYENLKYTKGKSTTYILFREPLPTEEEFKQLKKKVLQKRKLHRKDKMSYREFRKIFLKFGDTIPEYMFAEKILDISVGQLNYLNPKQTKPKKIKEDKKDEEDRTVQILLSTFMSDEERNELCQHVIKRYGIYPQRPITLEEFQRWYKNTNHILTENEFASEVLGIQKGSLEKLKSGAYKDIKAFGRRKFTQEEWEKYVKSLTPPKEKRKVGRPLKNVKIPTEDMVQKANKKGNRNNMAAAAQKIIASRKALNTSNINVLRNYLRECQEQFKEKSFSKKQLDLLEKCMLVLPLTIEDIIFFSRACVSFREYQRAITFILTYKNEKTLGSEEIKKLEELKYDIQYTLKKEQALKMLQKGERDTGEISRKCRRYGSGCYTTETKFRTKR